MHACRLAGLSPSTEIVRQFMPTRQEALSVWREGQLDLFHDPVCLEQNLADLLIVTNLMPGQLAALPVFQPFLGSLVTAPWRRAKPG